jgi:hypothetical protein
MPSVRDLLETAVPLERDVAASPAELRAIGRRRQRRSQAVGVTVGLVSVVAAGVVAVTALGPRTTEGSVAVQPTASAPSWPSPTPTITPPVTGADFAALVGTRWIPDLVNTGVTTTQAYPDERGAAPRALVTFGAGHVLVVDYVENGRTTTVRGTWVATSGTPALDARALGSLRLTVTAPAGAPAALVRFVNRLSLAAAYGMVAGDGAPPSLAPLTMLGYSVSNVTVIAIDLVKPGVVLPSAYPQRP